MSSGNNDWNHTEDEVRQWFNAVDTDGSGELTIEELRQALKNADNSSFSYQTIILIVRMINTRNTDTLNLNEFHAMMIYIDRWRKMFNLFDIDGNNSIDREELKEALYRLKLQISDHIIQLLLKKYSRNFDGETVNFDQFMNICISLNSITESFRYRDRNRQGKLNLNYEEFLVQVINLI
ncbi:EF-hand [Neocallimastix lanati (nom. inval.)]|jgi:Ca2+-binding EF-hand superfamily protein|uniref:EF-hand n=1 Tax=Neocallimastix californiae TaxID=1754190 RepID=A0A1Y2C293_9FUNG|nr:EF-hand [Neocallimastix sp. JGI-2020a]ORY41163.1 EF-hand [Neocallimastix californiae]|eukprot:ORY41163.1 EF-hand [Neocallimastix californiae]